MAVYHLSSRMIGRSNGGSPVKALAYMGGVSLSDERTGEAFCFDGKSVQHVQILLPKDAPMWARELQELISTDRTSALQVLSDIANRAEKRVDAQVYREVEVSLPRELTFDQRKVLAGEYAQDQFCGLGMLAVQSFHLETAKDGQENPHCHTFFLTRELVEEGLSKRKNVSWNSRALHQNWREQWGQYATFHLKLHGHDITLDHRSYKDQGLDIEPQIKLGKPASEKQKREMEREWLFKGQKVDDRGDSSFGYDFEREGFGRAKTAEVRLQEFRSIQLRNLYRIIRRPEVVFEIVTRNHATFMWGDVQKVLARYTSDATLFQRLDGRLRGSSELLLLKPSEGEDKSIYTTRSMLKAEKSLVQTAETLSNVKSHEVAAEVITSGMARVQEKLQEAGYNFSEGQERAIRHLTAEGQLKCIVGYAGAGKTTALEACRDIWEEAGYRVYGLAPTGRAAQNLESSGIKSQTLHRFLKSFEEGRCQYDRGSVVVLDEAGMVDVQRFEQFLGAVKTLGIKAVVVGDAGQLQPVEAGPAFRLVSERIATSRLEEVVRQRESWQREATVLFGRQAGGEALQAYLDRGRVHLVEETLPEGRRQDVVLDRYRITARTSGLIFREILKDIQKEHPEATAFNLASQHQDYATFKAYRQVQVQAAQEILGNPDVYRASLKERGLDPLEMARLLVVKEHDKASQYRDARELLQEKKLDHLIGLERGSSHGVEVRGAAKVSLLEDWQKEIQENPEKTLLMVAYSNRDVRDLNVQAREILKSSGVISKEDVSYTITREIEDDFGRRGALKEAREFSVGDRLVFTRNKEDLGVRNGSCGTILSLEKKSIEVKLDTGKTLTFSPQIFPYFDQGWAVTIHKAQGVTVDKSFVLASHEMTQNLTYVALTRHRDDVQLYGSTHDFWREEKIPDVLSKSGEKLGAGDYLSAESLETLMKDEDKFLGKLFTRLSDELQAMGAVSKKAFEAVADYFLGRELARDVSLDIFVKPEVQREEARAEEILRTSKEEKSLEEASHSSPSENTLEDLTAALQTYREKVIQSLDDVRKDFENPAFQTSEAEVYKDAFTRGLEAHGEEKALEYWISRRERALDIYEQKLDDIQKMLASPLLEHLSEETRERAMVAAFENPDQVLGRLTYLQASKQVERDLKVDTPRENVRELSERQPSLSLAETLHDLPYRIRDPLIEKFGEVYGRFKELSHELQDSPKDKSLLKEYRDLGRTLLYDEECYKHLKSQNKEAAQEIQKAAEIQLERSKGYEMSL